MDIKRSDYIEWEVLNPEAEYDKPVQELAPRLTDLDNKKIGLFGNGKPNADKLLDALGELLQKRYPNLAVIKYPLWIGAGDENIRRMAEECDGVIAAVGD